MAATAAVMPGVGSRSYYNTGTYGTPTWTAVGLVKDDPETSPWDMVEAGSKATKAKLYAKARRDIGFQLVIRADPADTAYNAIADAAETQTTLVDMMILDGPVTQEGCRGQRAEFHVNPVSKPKEIDGVVYVTFDLKPGWSSNGYPKSVKMGSGSTPTFTEL